MRNLRKAYYNKLLFLILLVSAIFRLWNLSSIPPGLTPDEASLGYNAYSILKTGRDEYGEFLPAIFKSFGDYKPGLYVYLTVPFVSIFGLTEFAVRLPSALAGVIAVYLLYLIANELFKDKQSLLLRNRKFVIWNLSFGIWPALLLAISPWHIHFSRGAWEANLSLTLTLFGIFFFLKTLKNPKFLLHSSIFFSLTILTYQGAKLSSLIVLIVLTIAYWNHCKSLIKKTTTTVVQTTVIGLIIISPILLSLFQQKAGRLEVFSIFSYRRPAEQVQEIAAQGNEKVGGLTFNLFHSEGINYLRAIGGRWFNHFSTRFLFFEGDWQNPRHSSPNHGMLLLADLAILIVGFVVLIRVRGKVGLFIQTSRKPPPKATQLLAGMKRSSEQTLRALARKPRTISPRLFIILWLILAPLPAALSRDEVHAVRSLNMVIPLTLVSSMGVVFLIQIIKKINNKYRYIFFSFSVLLYFSSFVYFLDSYFVHLPVHNAKYWFYGYKQAVNKTVELEGNYENVVFQQSYDQPYIFFLFYQRYDPRDYQKQAQLVEGGVDVGLVEKLDNITFEGFSWPYRTDRKNTLVVGNPVGIPAEINENDYLLVEEIKYPDGIEVAFRIVEVK